MSLQVEQSQFEDREQARRSSANDDDICRVFTARSGHLK
jgi:hypothetical protein